MASALSRGDWVRSGTGSLYLRNPRLNLWVGTIIVSILVVIGLLAPWVAPYDRNEMRFEAMLTAPGGAHPFGTDNIGRDVLSRVIYGARTDLLVGVIGALFPLILGIGIGLLPGLWGRWADFVVALDAGFDLVLPAIVILAVLIWGPSLVVFVAVLSLTCWVPYARLTRSPALKAGKLLSAACLVFAVSDVVLVMLVNIALSFLGLSTPPPAVDLGVIMMEGVRVIPAAWWIAFFPCLAIVGTAFGFSMLADGLAHRFGLRTR